MKRFFGMFTIIMIVLVACMGLVFAGDSTAVAKAAFNIKNIDWLAIMKWAGLVIGGLGAGGVTFVNIFFAILKYIPNAYVDTFGDWFGFVLTKFFRQKIKEVHVDTAETTLIRLIRAIEHGMRRANPDLPNIDNK